MYRISSSCAWSLKDRVKKGENMLNYYYIVGEVSDYWRKGGLYFPRMEKNPLHWENISVNVTGFVLFDWKQVLYEYIGLSHFKW